LLFSEFLRVNVRLAPIDLLTQLVREGLFRLGLALHALAMDLAQPSYVVQELPASELQAELSVVRGQCLQKHGVRQSIPALRY
jgi:hypothetical protein